MIKLNETKPLLVLLERLSGLQFVGSSVENRMVVLRASDAIEQAVLLGCERLVVETRDMIPCMGCLQFTWSALACEGRFLCIVNVPSLTTSGVSLNRDAADEHLYKDRLGAWGRSSRGLLDESV